MNWLVLLALACWPSWVYLGARWGDGSDEPLGVVAALVLGGLMVRRGGPFPVPPGLPVAGLVVWSVLRPWAGELLGAALAVTVVAAVASLSREGRILPGWLGLALLSLPSLASLQFYLGYPARCAAAETARWLLGWQGFGLQRQGVELAWGSRRLLVDVPCSGLAMVWVTLLAAMTLAALARSGWRQTLGLGLLALGSAWLTNVLRLTGLFFSELVLERPELHQAVGLAAFASGVGLVLLAAPCPAESPRTSERPLRPLPRWAWGLGMLAALGGALEVPGQGFVGRNFPGWPTHWDGQPLVLLEEVRLPAGWPLRAGRFRQGSAVLLLRWVDQPTRLLHSSLDCLRAGGWSVQGSSVSFQVARREAGSQLWTGQERIRDAQGREFGDVSQWYWEAVLGRSAGPWWAVTRLSPSPVVGPGTDPGS